MYVKSRGVSVCLFVVFLIGAFPCTNGDVASDVQAVQDDYWTWRLREWPEFATRIGVNDNNDRVEVYSISEFYDRKDLKTPLPHRITNMHGENVEVPVSFHSKPALATAVYTLRYIWGRNPGALLYCANLSANQTLTVTITGGAVQLRLSASDGMRSLYEVQDYANSLLQRLVNIEATSDFREISAATKVNYQVLRNSIETYVDGFRWYTYTAVNPINFIEGPQTELRGEFLAPFNTTKDFNDFLTRMLLSANQIDEQISLMRYAVFSGHTNHNVSMHRVIDQIDTTTANFNSTDSGWYRNFAVRVDNFTGPGMNASSKSYLKNKALHVVGDYLFPAYQRLKTYISNEYLPSTREEIGIYSLSGGSELYAERLKWFLSVDMTPSQVHQKGLQEVARITGNMLKILDRHNFTGSIQQFIDGLKNETTLHLTKGEEILAEYKQLIFNRITPKLPQLFKDIPIRPLEIQLVNNRGPAGEYTPVAEDDSRPGIFRVNLQEPNSKSTYEMMAIALQETLPGQHMQTIFAQKGPLPEYRKNVDLSKFYKVPFQFPIDLAYREGWALYAGYLGQELGLYKDDFELMARYKSEMFHACTMVVDTGIHSMGWSRDQAMTYMDNHDVTLPREFIADQIDAYISSPGEGCAYRIGELKIRELREKASHRLGTHFDIRDFHSVVLNAGPMPLNILEEVVDDWIKEKIRLIPVNPIG